jgi:hypothetical protein
MENNQFSNLIIKYLSKNKEGATLEELLDVIDYVEKVRLKRNELKKILNQLLDTQKVKFEKTKYLLNT